MMDISNCHYGYHSSTSSPFIQGKSELYIGLTFITIILAITGFSFILVYQIVGKGNIHIFKRDIIDPLYFKKEKNVCYCRE